MHRPANGGFDDKWQVAVKSGSLLIHGQSREVFLHAGASTSLPPRPAPMRSALVSARSRFPSLGPQRVPRAAALAERGIADSRLRRVWFELRAAGLRGLRTARNLRERARGQHLAGQRLAGQGLRVDEGAWPVAAGASRTPLWNSRDAAEFKLTAGKVHNLRVAARRLDGLLIPQGAVFSFWRALGRPSRARGYAAGRELREGCMVASVGGGLCQLSNALYAAALEAGLPILERHAHSRIVPGSLAERGLDATVFWNYLDLRFRAPADCLLRVELTATHLNVRLLFREALRAPVGAAPREPLPGAHPALRVVASAVPGPVRQAAHDCIACANQDCVDYITPQAQAGQGAWLLDEVWPEFDQWLLGHARAGDRIVLPLDGRSRKRPAYAWSLDRLPGAQVIEHGVLTVARALATRLLSPQGAARQRGLARMEAALARAYARDLVPEVDHVTVSLNLLPHLWASGALAGRRLTVLMNRSPLALLHAQLDRARSLHPESPTLGDFRAPAELLALEQQALVAADRLVTPHRAVAQYCRAQYGEKVEQLDWRPPAVAGAAANANVATNATNATNATTGARPPAQRGGAVLFPASALGRKGAYEVRDACRELKLPVLVWGEAREQDGFWDGVQVGAVNRRDPWAGVACVALPAFVEHRPRLLLQARARGLSVVCSEDCGLPAQEALRTVRAGHLPEFTEALARAAA